MPKDYIREAEQNVVNICKVFVEIRKIVDCLATIGNKYCHDHIAKDDFFKGVQTISRALDIEHANAIHNCFIFTGIGGEEALEYARESFKETFDSDYQYIMRFLSKWGQRTTFYDSDVEKEFRKQAKEKIKD